MAKADRMDRWRRDPGAPFDDLRREDYAKARAKGGTIRASAGHAGVEYTTTARQWERHPEMLARIRELRGNAENFVGVSVGYILAELKKNVEIAREAGQLKSSTEALKIMYDIVTTNPDVAQNTARALPPQLDQKTIKRRLLESLKADSEAPQLVETTAEPVESDDDEAAE